MILPNFVGDADHLGHLAHRVHAHHVHPRKSRGGQRSLTLYSAIPVRSGRQVVGAVLVSGTTLRILAEETKQQEVAVQAAQKALDLALAQYRAGLTSYLDVITAQNALLTNQRSALTIEGQRMTASVGLIKALGGGWDRAMLPI